MSAAVEAARLGVQVTLIDEHPVELALMGQEIPLHFGQRMITTVSNKAEMLTRVVAASPMLQTAEDAGVDIRLGTMVWDSSRDKVLALADDTRSWRLGYEAVVFASGARDLGIAFPGWERAGVTGAGGLLTLLDKYQAFSGQRIAILGSGALGLHVARRAIERGVEVACIVDISPEARGQGDLEERLVKEGVPFYLSHTVKEAKGDTEVTSLIIGSDGDDKEIECDTICLAIGLVPSIELIYWIGCQIQFDQQRGGFVPLVEKNMQTTYKEIFVAGDAAGFDEEQFINSEVAATQGRIAAISAAQHLGAIDEGKADILKSEMAVPASTASSDSIEYRQAWIQSIEAGDITSVPICICEEVTHGDLSSMMERGPTHPDHLKRLTRAGMGYCQGRRCREQIQILTSQFMDVDVGQVELASYRPPFRPLPLGLIQNRDLSPEEEDSLFAEWHRQMREEYLHGTDTRD